MTKGAALKPRLRFGGSFPHSRQNREPFGLAWRAHLARRRLRRGRVPAAAGAFRWCRDFCASPEHFRPARFPAWRYCRSDRSGASGPSAFRHVHRSAVWFWSSGVHRRVPFFAMRWRITHRGSSVRCSWPRRAGARKSPGKGAPFHSQGVNDIPLLRNVVTRSHVGTLEAHRQPASACSGGGAGASVGMRDGRARRRYGWPGNGRPTAAPGSQGLRRPRRLAWRATPMVLP